MILTALHKLLLMVEPLALAILLVYIYGFFRRTIPSIRLLNAMMGGMFGIAAVVAMSSPLPLAEGVIIDIRNLFVGVAGAYFGFLGGVIAAAFGIVTRFSIGGAGMISGIGGMFISCLMGLAWANFVRPRISSNLKAYFVLGGMISCHMSMLVFLPTAVQVKFLMGPAQTLLALNLMGAVLLSTLIRRERDLINESSRLLEAASTDPLTKLINRDSAAVAFAALPDLMDNSLGQTMLCIDVDEFKSINDTHGHLRGDKVLVDIANRLAACLRPTDIFSRISGDEFVIVLHNINSIQAKAVAERCREAVSSVTVLADEAEINVSISIGGVWTHERPSFRALRETADDALYRAKALGRNCVAFDVIDDFQSPAIA